MIDATKDPVHARPKGVYLIRDGQKIPLELSFRGINDDKFGVWQICTKIRPNDRVRVQDLGFNFIRGEYES